MKVVHIVAGDLSGGAAQGAYTLHNAQNNIGIDSSLLISGRINIVDDKVESLSKSNFRQVKNRLLHRIGNSVVLFYRNRKRWLFNTGFVGLDFTKFPAYKDADIVHLHWINGFVSLWALRKIKKPIVWTMRDMWPMTGGCHYSMECDNYHSGCGKCPQLGSKNRYDLSRLVNAIKRLTFPKNMELVGVSKWLTTCAAKSLIFKSYNINTISNGVNTCDFYPVDSIIARQKLLLPLDKKIILIGAQNLDDVYKGSELIKDVLERITIHNFHVVFFGNNAEKILNELNVESTNLGFITNKERLRWAYSASDVFVSLSKMEAFGKTLVESMACGTPVVCFDATGPADIVEHLCTGYKALPYSPSDVALGIDWLLNMPTFEIKRICQNAYNRAHNYYDSKKIAVEYMKLYERLLSKSDDNSCL